jgi:hypothetical protein
MAQSVMTITPTINSTYLGNNTVIAVRKFGKIVQAYFELYISSKIESTVRLASGFPPAAINTIVLLRMPDNTCRQIRINTSGNLTGFYNDIEVTSNAVIGYVCYIAA